MQLYDHDLERTVNGSLLLLSDDIQLPLIHKLNLDCFHNGAQRAIYQVISKMASDGLEITSKSLKAQINKLGNNDYCGGDELIERTINDGIATNKLSEYITLIQEYHNKRRINEKAHEIINMLGDHSSVEYIVQSIDKWIKDLDLGEPEHYCLRDCLEDVRDKIKDRKAQNGIMPEWMPEGLMGLFPDGLTNGSLVTIKAKSSHGKSTLAGQTALQLAGKGKNILYITCEDGRYIFGMRAMCHLTGNNHKQLLSMKDEIKTLFDDLPDFTKRSDNFIIECNTSNWMEIERLILSTNLRTPLDLIVVDYLQLLSNGGGVDQKTLDLESIGRGAKSLAMKLKTVIIMVSQMKEDGGAKWCAALTDYCDAEIILEPKDINDLKSAKPDIIMRIKVTKNKISGGCGIGELIWHRPLFKFEPHREVKKHEEFIQGNSDYD